jgi:hypothetical protein
MADRPSMFRTHPSVTSTAPPEVVYDVIADLRNHLVWSGERAESDGFKMLSLDAPVGPATVGTTFTSTGTAGKDTFHDRSVVTEAARPHRFVIETDARLERRRAKTWLVHFSHRYDGFPTAGSTIVYTDHRARELRPVLAQAGDPDDLPAVRQPRRSQAAAEPGSSRRGALEPGCRVGSRA